MSTLSKDSKIEELRIDQDELLIKANLVAKTSEAPSLVSFSGALTATTVSINLKEPIKSCERVQLVNRASGASEDKLAAAPIITHTLEDGSTKVSTSYVSADGKIVSSAISAVVDATGLSDICIVVSFRK